MKKEFWTSLNNSKEKAQKIFCENPIGIFTRIKKSLSNPSSDLIKAVEHWWTNPNTIPSNQDDIIIHGWAQVVINPPNTKLGRDLVNFAHEVLYARKERMQAQKFEQLWKAGEEVIVIRKKTGTSLLKKESKRIPVFGILFEKL